ncbi:MAG: fumarylacetoacetate hydrolase family protein [Myxococcota bacterium]
MKIVRLEDGRWADARGDTFHVLSAAPWDEGTPTGETLSSASLAAPVSPSKVVCVGRNYAAHAKELGNEVPSEPLLFLKPPSAIIGPGEPVLLPPQSQRVEHEAELAAVIGTRIFCGDRDAAKKAVFGFTIANDVTARDIQRGDVQFTRGKGFDTFCPIGPAVVTDVDPSDLAIQLWVSGKLRQDGRTSAMVWDAFDLIAYISTVMTLLPGDLVLTGTPKGVGPLAPNDEVRISIEDLGTLTHGVLARSDVHKSGNRPRN